MILHYQKDRIKMDVRISRAKLEGLVKIGAIKKNARGQYRGVSNIIDEAINNWIADYYEDLQLTHQHQQ